MTPPLHGGGRGFDSHLEQWQKKIFLIILIKEIEIEIEIIKENLKEIKIIIKIIQDLEIIKIFKYCLLPKRRDVKNYSKFLIII